MTCCKLLPEPLPAWQILGSLPLRLRHPSPCGCWPGMLQLGTHLAHLLCLSNGMVECQFSACASFLPVPSRWLYGFMMMLW